MELYQPQPNEPLTYHNGAVLQGDIPVSVLWYGHFTPAQKAVVSDFLLSLTATSQAATPSVSQWWNSRTPSISSTRPRRGARTRSTPRARR